MVKKIVTGYTIFSLLFFMVVIAHLSIRLKTLYDQNHHTINNSFNEIVKELKSTFLSINSFDQSVFFNKVKNTVREGKRLRLLAIYSSNNGPYFIYSEDKRLLHKMDKAKPLYQKATGQPVYTDNPVNRFGLLTITLPFTYVLQEHYFIDAWFVILSPEELFPHLFNSLILIVIFFIASLIIYGLLASVNSGTGSPSFSPAGTPDAGGLPTENTAGNPQPASRKKIPDALALTQEERRKGVTAGVPPGVAPAVTGPRVTGPRSLFSPSTGLGWKEHFTHKLQFELERAASFDQDLTLVLISIDEYNRIQDAQELYAELAGLLLNEFKYPDLLFENGTGHYALILPDLEWEGGIKSLELFKNKVVSMPWGGITITCGLSARNGRLVEESRLLQEAQSALDKAKAAGKNQIIVFRADPEQYREFLSDKALEKNYD